MSSVVINNNTYEIPKMDFDTVCQLEENGISLLTLNEENPKVATMLRALVAWIIGCTPRQASAEIQAHLENGGDITELLTVITDALNDTGFSNGNRQKTSEFPTDHQRKSQNRKKSGGNTKASQKS